MTFHLSDLSFHSKTLEKINRIMVNLFNVKGTLKHQHETMARINAIYLRLSPEI